MDAPDTEPDHIRYLVTLAASLALWAALVFGVNWLVDPLWFDGGNRLGERNFVYNERVSKLNQLVDAPALDCVVLGDSRVSLLDADRIEGARCFNLAFAGGNLRDLERFAGYVEGLGLDLRRVIVGIGMFNFTDQPLPDNAPAFVHAGAPPPGPLASYFSTEIFAFSVRALLERSPSPIYYDRAFHARILRDPGSYDRNPALSEQNWSFFMHPGPFVDERLPMLRRAVSGFGDAQRIGYVPPITASFVLGLDDEGTLESYVSTLHEVAGLFDVFYDFSIPGPTTLDADATFDGQHFYEEVNHRIAERLNGEENGFGVEVTALDLATYRARFLEDVAAARRSGA